MRIALINPIIQTVDRPKNFWSLFGRSSRHPLATDSEVNYVKLAKAIAALGHEVTLFISDVFQPKQRGLPEENLTIRYLPTAGKFFFPPAYIPFLPTLPKELKEGKFDIIQATELFQPSTVMAAFASSPVVVWEEIDQYFSRKITRLLQKGYHRTVEKWLRKKVFVVARSRASLNFLQGRGWDPAATIIPHPVDTDIFNPLPDLPEEYLLVVSRLAFDKGLSFLLEVLAKVKTKKPDIRLVVVGQGEASDVFQKEARQRKLEGNLRVVSNFLSHAELNRVYNGSTMTLITTVGGLYPFTASESMACGKPVVSRFKRALGDLVLEDQTGYLIDTDDAMAAKILALLENPQKRRQMGRNARQRVEMFCNLKRVASQFVETYGKLLNH